MDAHLSISMRSKKSIKRESNGENTISTLCRNISPSGKSWDSIRPSIFIKLFVLSKISGVFKNILDSPYVEVIEVIVMYKNKILNSFFMLVAFISQDLAL